MANKSNLWALGQKAEQASKLPSECVPGLEDEIGAWGIYCFDNAVCFFMRVMQNALLERDKLGDESKQRYTLDELLGDDFRLPRPLSPRKARAGQGWRAIARANPGIVSHFRELPKAV